MVDCRESVLLNISVFACRNIMSEHCVSLRESHGLAHQALGATYFLRVSLHAQGARAGLRDGESDEFASTFDVAGLSVSLPESSARQPIVRIDQKA